MRRLHERLTATVEWFEWPLGFSLFLVGFAIFLASAMENVRSIEGAILATIGIVVALDAVGREGWF